MANRNWMNGNKLYTNITAPSLVSCNFIVDSTNGNGLGVRSLKSNGYVKAVYMHTSATPAGGNPNPGSGYIMIQLTDNYAKSVAGMHSFVSPTTGSDLSTRTADAALTVGQPYLITVVGSATAANWLAMGLPAGTTPAVGQPFIATSTGTGTSTTSKVRAIGVSSIFSIETIGDTRLNLAPQGTSNQGGWIILQTLAPTLSTGAYVSPMAPTAPANGTVIALSFLFDNSSVTVDGI